MSSYGEGKAIAKALLKTLEAVTCRVCRQKYVASSIGDLIDVPLDAGSISATNMRMLGFAQVLAANMHWGLPCAAKSHLLRHIESHPYGERCQSLHHALLSQIDVPLNWSNLEATVSRISEFAGSLTDMLPNESECTGNQFREMGIFSQAPGLSSDGGYQQAMAAWDAMGLVLKRQHAQGVRLPDCQGGIR